MIIDSTDERKLIAELSKEIVSQIAPEELELFDELMQEYFDNPVPPDLTVDDSDDALGFGLSEVMVAITPAAAAVTIAALGFIVSTVQQFAKDQSAELPARGLRQFFVDRKQAAIAESPLTPAQLEELRRITQITAIQYGMDDERAEAMTNAVLVTLMLGADGGSPIRRPIKILFLAVSPKGISPLRLDEEIRSIDQVLRQSRFRERFHIEQHWAVRVSELQGLLLRHQPDIVHFSGHGSPTHTLIFENDTGEPTEVPYEALSEIFQVLQKNVRCVVLNACYSEIQAAAIASHIDAVIGMSDLMGDQAAISFAAAFYQALGYDKDVPTAFTLGVNQIKLHGLADHAVPKLLHRQANRTHVHFAQV